MSEVQSRALRNGAIAAGIVFAVVLFERLHHVVTMQTVTAPCSYALIAFLSVYDWSLPARLGEQFSLRRVRYPTAMAKGAAAAVFLVAMFGFFFGEFGRYVEWRQSVSLLCAAVVGAWIGNLTVNLQNAKMA